MSTDQPQLPLGPIQQEAEEESASIRHVRAASILTPASGFMSAYDYTLNPYGGCGFGCHYCYAAFFARDIELQRTWGDWVHIKDNAVALLRRRRRSLSGMKIYMSSVTDPYQPIERRLELTRQILHELVSDQPHLVVQTRGPLVTRDIDLFSRFKQVRINVTITTDDEAVRRAFEPRCPSNRQRLQAVRKLSAAGLPVHVTMTPLLPLRDPAAFAKQLQQSGARGFVVQPFHADHGRFKAGTRTQAVEVAGRMAWDEKAYRHATAVLRSVLPQLREGQDGFRP